MTWYEYIRNNMPNHTTIQATKTEIVPLKKSKSIEHALFDVEGDPQNNQVRIKTDLSI